MSELKFCNNCAFYLKDRPNAGEGCCYYHAPPFGYPGVNNGDEMARTSDKSWCGSWEPLSWRDLPDDTAPKLPLVTPFALDDSHASEVFLKLLGAPMEAIDKLIASVKPKRPRKSRAKPSETQTTLVPDQPTPGSVTDLWDAVYLELTGTPYTKGSRTGEYVNAAKLVKAIAAQDRDWSRIEKAMRNFHRDSWARGQDFNVFCQKFSRYDGEKDLPSAGGF